MKTIARENELQGLERQLQHALQTQLPQPLLLKLKCAFNQEVLVILVEHRSKTTINAQDIFAVLVQTLHQANTQPVVERSGSSELLPVRLYLRLLGQQQPYAVYPFILDPDGSVPEEAIAPKSDEETPPAPSLSPEKPIGSAIVLATTASIVPPLEETPAQSVNPLDAEDDLSSLGHSPLPVGVIVLAAAVGITAFVGSLYALTRPCVIGQCSELETAQQLYQDAVQTTQNTTSAKQVVEAYDNLVEAVYLLDTIPPWSSRHQQAQALLASYDAKSQVVKQVVSALEQANKAAQKSQNPPHPLADWQEIQRLWQGAIARLEQVPQNSPFFQLARHKLDDYRANLSTINQRILLEQTAQETINLAKSTADTASARSSSATQLDDWQLAHTTWQTAISLLQEVPRGTMAYAEAQQLSAIYQPKLAETRDRFQHETIAATAYEQAVRFAKQAQNYEQQGQWVAAVEQWRSAVAYAQQVPTGTLYHSQAQPLVTAYTTALATAQQKQQTLKGIQLAQTDLDRTCAGTPKVCTYSVSVTEIQVRITADYDQAVKQAIASTESTGDVNTRIEVTNHVNMFLRAIAAISENTNVPIALYNSDGSLFGTYVPDLSGFVPN